MHRGVALRTTVASRTARVFDGVSFGMVYPRQSGACPFAMIRYDLHCHSTYSDGLLPPAEVVRLAASRGVEVLALTDHDETAGLAEARAAALEAGITLVNGSELSVTWEGETIHVVALGIDPGERDAVRRSCRRALGTRRARAAHRRFACRRGDPRRLRRRQGLRDERSADLAHALRALPCRHGPRA